MLIFPLPAKEISVMSYEYMDSERHAFLNTSGGHKLCKVNKTLHYLSSKWLDFFPNYGVTHSYTKDHDTILVKLSTFKNPWSCIIEGKTLYPKGFTQCCDSTNWSAFIRISKQPICCW